MSLHVILGAGPVGSCVAKLLAERGDQVRLVSRRGAGPEHAAIERVRADGTDVERLCELAAGAAALYNCANPLYHRWLVDWPPLAAALLEAAERTGPGSGVARAHERPRDDPAARRALHGAHRRSVAEALRGPLPSRRRAEGHNQLRHLNQAMGKSALTTMRPSA